MVNWTRNAAPSASARPPTHTTQRVPNRSSSPRPGAAGALVVAGGGGIPVDSVRSGGASGSGAREGGVAAGGAVTGGLGSSSAAVAVASCFGGAPACSRASVASIRAMRRFTCCSRLRVISATASTTTSRTAIDSMPAPDIGRRASLARSRGSPFGQGQSRRQGAPWEYRPLSDPCDRRPPRSGRLRRRAIFDAVPQTSPRHAPVSAAETQGHECTWEHVLREG